MKRFGAWLGVVILLGLMAGLMARSICEESATIDEGLLLASGHSYLNGHGFRLNPEHPPLAQTLSALPLLFLPVDLSEDMQALIDGRTGLELTRTWSGSPQPVAQLFPQGRRDWYFWPYFETDILGQHFLYNGHNRAEQLLTAGRTVQVALTLLTGLVIFLWVRRLANTETALLGLTLWVLNPLALAYGHLVLTDMGVTLMITLATWAYVRFFEKPNALTAIVAGLATGAALGMKFTAIVLAPIFFLTGIVHWRRSLRFLPVIIAAAWVALLLVYAPHWTPPPSLSPERTAALGVPGWFAALRPILIPADFFKGLALQFAHGSFGHEAFLHGEWSQHGWWYYFPLALLVKTPLPLLVLFGGGLAVACYRRQCLTAPWLASGVILLLAMFSTINIGVRYVLPMIPLLTIAAASQFPAVTRIGRATAWLLTGVLAIVTWRAHPHYLEYFNELAGGSRAGYRWLIDSNYDWGQDARRLQTYVQTHSQSPVYISYFGSPQALRYYEIPYQRIDAERARQLRDAWLVISATHLMRPEWNWLRETHQPVDRIGYTLFVYRLEQPVN